MNQRAGIKNVDCNFYCRSHLLAKISVADPGRYLTDPDPADRKKRIRILVRIQILIKYCTNLTKNENICHSTFCRSAVTNVDVCKNPDLISSKTRP